jgi:hypothetical protein
MSRWIEAFPRGKRGQLQNGTIMLKNIESDNSEMMEFVKALRYLGQAREVTNEVRSVLPRNNGIFEY